MKALPIQLRPAFKFTKGQPLTKTMQRLDAVFRIRSCLAVNSDPVHICRETRFIIQGITWANSDSGASLRCDRRPTALHSLTGVGSRRP
jgi:hypothetical protein